MTWGYPPPTNSEICSSVHFYEGPPFSTLTFTVSGRGDTPKTWLSSTTFLWESCFFFLIQIIITVRCQVAKGTTGKKKSDTEVGMFFWGNHFLFFLWNIWDGWIKWWTYGDPKRFRILRGCSIYTVYVYWIYLCVYTNLHRHIDEHLTMICLRNEGFVKMSRLEPPSSSPWGCEAARKEILFGSYFFHVAWPAFFLGNGESMVQGLPFWKGWSFKLVEKNRCHLVRPQISQLVTFDSEF